MTSQKAELQEACQAGERQKKKALEERVEALKKKDAQTQEERESLTKKCQEQIDTLSQEHMRKQQVLQHEIDEERLVSRHFQMTFSSALPMSGSYAVTIMFSQISALSKFLI